MKIIIASDHGGFEYKEIIKKYLINKKYEIIDVGTYSKESCHYPEYVKKACQLFLNDKNKEIQYIIFICSTGEGVTIAANRYKKIRCGIGYDDEVVKLMRQHNNANAIAFGEKFMKIDDCLRRIEIFLHTSFDKGRHLIRINMIDNINN